MKFFKILNMFGEKKEKNENKNKDFVPAYYILTLTFFVFTSIFFSFSNSFAETPEFFIRGNSFASLFLGRNNIFLFGLRNFELGGEAGKDFFYVKGVADIVPLTYSIFMTGTVQENTVMPSYDNLTRSSGSGDGIEEFFRIKDLFISTRGLPFVRVMLGRFFGRIGELNSQTFWDRNFVERPFTIRYFFGYDGFLDDGFDFSFSPPLPWTFEFGLQIFDGSEDPWRSPGSFDLTYLFFIKNSFGTPEVSGGLSLFWVTGKNRTAQSEFSRRDTLIRTQNFSEFFGGDAFVSLFPYLTINVGYILGRIQEPGLLKVEGGIYSEFAVNPVDFLTIALRPEIFGLPRNTFFDGGGSAAGKQIFELSLSATFKAGKGIKGRLQWTGNFGEGILPQNIIYLQGMFELP